MRVQIDVKAENKWRSSQVKVKYQQKGNKRGKVDEDKNNVEVIEFKEEIGK